MQQAQWSQPSQPQGQPQWTASAPQPLHHQSSSNSYHHPTTPTSPYGQQPQYTTSVGTQPTPVPLGGAMAVQPQPQGQPVQPSTVQAELMLKAQNITINEVNQGVQRNVLNGAELLVLDFHSSPQDLEAACQHLQLAPGSLTRTDGKPLLFVIAGDHKIPVIGSVPATKDSPFAFTFAMPTSSIEVVFPQSGAEDELDTFTALIHNHGTLRDNIPLTAPKEQKLSTKIAGRVGVASVFAATGIRKATSIASGAIGTGTKKIVENTNAAEKPVHVPSAVKGGVKATRCVTKGAVSVSTSVVGKLFGATAAVGHGVGSQIAKRCPPPNASSSDKLDGIKEVASAAVGGAGLVLTAATDAPAQVVSSGCDGVTTVVTHKLGAEAGEVTQEGLGVVEDVVTVHQTVHQVGVKAMLQETGKEAATQYITDTNMMERSNVETPSSPTGSPSATNAYSPNAV